MKISRLLIVLTIGVAGFVLGRSHAYVQEGMEAPAWTKLTEQHKKFAESVGEWDVAGNMWMAPGAPPMEFTATAKREMILKGRFVHETFNSNFMGQAFEGHLLQGYDTINKEVVTVWVDDTKPFISVSRGKEKDGTTIMTGRDPDFMTGEMKNTKSVITVVNANETRMKSYTVGADGTEHQTMELHYKRKK